MGRIAGGALATAFEAAGATEVNDEETETRALASVELLDAAIWREIASEEAQPPSAFLEALSTLIGRWLLVRSESPDLDLLTVMCRARGYVERRGMEETQIVRWTR